jgi:hypothetical protein
MTRSQFCTELTHLRKVAQNWVREHLNEAEAAAYKKEFDKANHHCSEAVKAAKTAVGEISAFVETNAQDVKRVPGLTLKDLRSGNDDFIDRVEQTAIVIAIFALELEITGRFQAEA